MKTVIVLGVGRCGSSMIAHILHTLGIYIGPTFIEANEYNKNGYWEDSTIMSIHEKMLKSIGRGWWNPPKTIEEVYNVPEALLNQLFLIFDRRMNQAQELGKICWGWKDPRTHWLLPIYNHNLVNSHYIFIHRDPCSIAKSVFYRDKKIVKTFDNTMNIVRDHYNQLGRLYDHSYPHLHISYREVLAEPRKIVCQIDDFLNIEVSSCVVNSAIDCVRPELRTW